MVKIGFVNLGNYLNEIFTLNLISTFEVSKVILDEINKENENKLKQISQT